MSELPIDQVIQGDCIQVLNEFPQASVDLIFADPPYNLQLQGDLWRPNLTRVDAVADEWDRFSSFDSYDEFSRAWLSACKRVLKEDGTLWVIGSYHNIFRIGKIIQDLGYWLLNDVIWIKTNPMPNFRGVRFTNAHETLIWASKNKGSKNTFNYHAMKNINGGKQMRSDWVLPICTGSERIKVDGKKAHPTQKPEALIYRVIVSSSQPGDVVLDPFFGTGTTGAVAKRLGRQWIGIERELKYVALARSRLEAIVPEGLDEEILDVSDQRRRQPRIPFSRLLEYGLLHPGRILYFRRNQDLAARIKPDGNLSIDGFEGSIHQSGRHLTGGGPCNGWDHWYFETPDGELHPIDELRQELRTRFNKTLDEPQEEGEKRNSDS